MKKKSKISVRRAVEMAFEIQGNLFHAPQLCREVRVITGRPLLMDGTILRRLREARADDLRYYYRVANSETSLYRKGVPV